MPIAPEGDPRFFRYYKEITCSPSAQVEDEYRCVLTREPWIFGVGVPTAKRVKIENPIPECPIKTWRSHMEMACKKETGFDASLNLDTKVLKVKVKKGDEFRPPPKLESELREWKHDMALMGMKI